MVKRVIVDPEVKEWMLTNHVKFLHKIVVVCRGKILVLRRMPSDHARANAWDLPGGNSSWPETNDFLENPHLDDIGREVAEETGLDINSSKLIPIYLATGYDPEREKYTVLSGQMIVLESDELPEIVLSEHSDYRWVDAGEVDSLDFGEGGDYLQDIVSKGLNFVKAGEYE